MSPKTPPKNLDAFSVIFSISLLFNSFFDLVQSLMAKNKWWWITIILNCHCFYLLLTLLINYFLCNSHNENHLHLVTLIMKLLSQKNKTWRQKMQFLFMNKRSRIKFAYHSMSRVAATKFEWNQSILTNNLEPKMSDFVFLRLKY